MTGTQPDITTIDEYIATFPEEKQSILRELRETIRAAAPDAREKISYKMAAFELNGRDLVYFAAWKNHISLYPIPTGNAALNELISQYRDGKGTLKFPLDRPLPFQLISKIVSSRVSENVEKYGPHQINTTKGK